MGAIRTIGAAMNWLMSAGDRAMRLKLTVVGVVTVFALAVIGIFS
jgi:hypothetical protein